jgi:hypothetical protein
MRSRDEVYDGELRRGEPRAYEDNRGIRDRLAKQAGRPTLRSWTSVRPKAKVLALHKQFVLDVPCAVKAGAGS